MTSCPETLSAEPQPAIAGLAPQKPWCSLLALLLRGRAASESVETKLRLRASPETIWNHLLFYEEILSPPPLLLRALIPQPVRTEGDKTTPGSTILCTYRQGHLVKRITAFETRSIIAFEVVEQELGIESCVLAKSGSYRLRRCPAGTELLLTTNYQAHLRPRPFFRPLEKLAIHRLHRHILNGIRRVIASSSTQAVPVLAECAVPVGVYPARSLDLGEEVCTISQSPSRRLS